MKFGDAWETDEKQMIKTEEAGHKAVSMLHQNCLSVAARTVNFSLKPFFPQTFLSLFMWTAKWKTLNDVQQRLSENVRSFSYI